MIFHSGETRDPASSYIHPPLIFGHSLQFSPFKKYPCCDYSSCLQGIYSSDRRFSIFLTHNLCLYHCYELFRAHLCRIPGTMLHQNT